MDLIIRTNKKGKEFLNLDALIAYLEGLEETNIELYNEYGDIWNTSVIVADSTHYTGESSFTIGKLLLRELDCRNGYISLECFDTYVGKGWDVLMPMAIGFIKRVAREKTINDILN